MFRNGTTVNKVVVLVVVIENANTVFLYLPVEMARLFYTLKLALSKQI